MEIQKLHRVSDRIWYMDPTVETDRPQLGYIRGDRMSAMVDAGNSPAHAALFFDSLLAEGLPLPSLCLITHWHWDHVLGIPGLGIPSVCCEKTAQILRDNLGMAAELYDGDECVRAEYSSPSGIKVEVPAYTFGSSFSADLGGVTARCLFVGGPHSEDGTLVCVPEEGFVFGGQLQRQLLAAAHRLRHPAAG